SDPYRCPQGERLKLERIKSTEEVAVYRGNPTACWTCPPRTGCTDSRVGRMLNRSVFADIIERVKGYAVTEPFQKARRKRQVWVEPLFGEAKDWHGLRRFRVRGLWKVNCEGLRIAAGQNLKRWLTNVGWGRRWGPAGSLALTATAQP